ncbi:MAG: DUF6152 family protein, partial [Pseudomonadota bacterium]
MKFFKLLLAGLAVGTLASTAVGHHSTNGIYDQTVETELEGTVKAWRFINPHPSLTLTVKGADGVEHDWDLSYGGSAVAHLKRRGYTVDTFKVGDKIIAKGHPALAAGQFGLLMEGGGGDPTYADGKPLPGVVR